MKRLFYKEGDWFALPLERGGFVVGRITRMAKTGKVLLGYFFGPRRDVIPNAKELENLLPKEAIAIYRFGDLDLYEGRWSVISNTKSWHRKEWPIPTFVRSEEPLVERYWLVQYSDDDLYTPFERQISKEEAQSLDEDSLYGSGAVEIALDSKL